MSLGCSECKRGVGLGHHPDCSIGKAVWYAQVLLPQTDEADACRKRLHAIVALATAFSVKAQAVGVEVNKVILLHTARTGQSYSGPNWYEEKKALDAALVNEGNPPVLLPPTMTPEALRDIAVTLIRLGVERQNGLVAELERWATYIEQ